MFYNLTIICFFLINTIIYTKQSNYSFVPQTNLKRKNEFEAISYLTRREESTKQFLLNYKSTNPVVILVDNTIQSNKDAANFMKIVFKLSKKAENINFILMKFNTSGVSSVLETTYHNKVKFNEILNNENIEEPSAFLGYDNLNKSAAFFGILNACYILPSHSGIVVFINRGADDEDIAEHALIELKKKEIRVYIIWGGGKSESKNDESILEDIARFSGGKFIINTDRDPSIEYHQQFIKNAFSYQNVSIILVKKNMIGLEMLTFPINSDVTGIHINITPNITNGVLTTPKGHKIDVLESEDVSQYTKGSFLIRDTNAGIHEIHLNTTTASLQDIGIWHLHINNARIPYNITILVYSKLTTNAFISPNNLSDFEHKSVMRNY